MGLGAAKRAAKSESEAKVDELCRVALVGYTADGMLLNFFTLFNSLKILY